MESDLIARLKEGDRTAFNAIYDLYVRRLLAFALKHVPQPQDAEDLVQDVFIALWNNRFTIRNNETLQPLLFAALRNRIINFHKSRINSPVYYDYIEIMAGEAQADNWQPIEYNEFKHMLFDLIATLTPTEQRVIKLSRFDNKSNQEIASILNLSQQTVRNSLSTGLKKLKEKLKRGNFNKIITFLAFLQVLS